VRGDGACSGCWARADACVPAAAALPQAAGLLENESARAEAAVLQEVNNILAGVKDVSWPSGKPENN
jgi:hypothetical protein